MTRRARQVLIFGKYPEPGRVKTRLAASIGVDNAAQIAAQLLELTIQRLSPLMSDGIDVILYIDPPEREPDFRNRFGDDLNIRSQPAGDLTARLTAAYEYDRSADIIVVGSDCPGITSNLARDAFAQITDRQMVFGPTDDGGFYLMGARGLPDGFFRNIRWSSEVTLSELEQRAEDRGFRLVRLPRLFDVDTHSDLQQWQAGDFERE
ncbi:MAG: DUF2064 domain-containing protein [candidate division Zixibacteria bacterium]|nr:DUF2064 domain-containing protein [candidate division Zixibacteria bacterium]